MRVLFYTLLLCLPVSVSAQVKQIIVPVTLTYRGAAIKAVMSVDTGASTTTIGPALAERLGIPADCPRGGRAQMADGRAVGYCTVTMDITAGDSMTETGVDVNIMDYTSVRAVDGWLGTNFLSKMTMTLDWKNRRIYWSK